MPRAVKPDHCWAVTGYKLPVGGQEEKPADSVLVVGKGVVLRSFATSRTSIPDYGLPKLEESVTESAPLSWKICAICHFLAMLQGLCGDSKKSA